MIDYQLLADSVSYYKSNGFTRIETPWTVTKAISEITKPIGANDYEIKDKNKVLVASGEQSFLYLYLKGFLPKGRFQTITPCFRDEPFDFLHTKYFIKNELIITDNVTNIELLATIDLVKKFFFKYFTIEPKIIQTEEFGYDLIIDDPVKNNPIELGSYGIRHCEYLSWIYGTGLAEPRTSNLLLCYQNFWNQQQTK